MTTPYAVEEVHISVWEYANDHSHSLKITVLEAEVDGASHRWKMFVMVELPVL